ncbi:MAG: hypothetical protein WAW75_10285, partial [Gallionella sp.]
RQQATFFCFAKMKVAKEKATPVSRPCGVPCVARLVRRLRNSHSVLKQSSPTSPDQPALLGGAQGMKNKKPKFKTQNPKPKIRRVGTGCPPYKAYGSVKCTELLKGLSKPTIQN